MAITINTLITLLNIQILGNEIWRILAFIISLLLVYPVSKISSFITNKILLSWAEKSKIKFDDILVKSLNPSINMFVLAGMFYFGSSFLNQGKFANAFDKAFNFLIIIPIVFFLIKFSTEAIGFYLKEDKKRGKINEAAIDLLMQIVRIALFIVGILLILGNLGYDISALLAGLGVGGLAFALAAKDILTNFFAGISLIFDKAFNKGERVKFEGYAGRIEELRLRTTKIRTYDGTVLTIPNSLIAENIIENVTKIPKIKISQTFGLVYGTSTKKIEKAKKIIEKAILEEEKTDKENYYIWFDNFGDYSLDIKVIYYGLLSMEDWPERAYFKERINLKILKEFEKEGIELAFPTQTIELQKKKNQ